ncbi:phosphodiesterase [Candidatus Levyibacteriota bacterium]|nr:phosphodiesterase [Candidatus Levybacteria bacterium]
MIHSGILDILKIYKKNIKDDEFVYPNYGSFSLAEIVPTILAYFNINQERNEFAKSFFPKQSSGRKILLFLVDGLSYSHFVKNYDKSIFFNSLALNGDVFPITSVFPSTTPAALTTIHTGLTPQEHGLPEWTVYFEEFDKVIETLPFRPILTRAKDTLMMFGGHPELLYKGQTIYQTLKDNSIPSYIFVSQEHSLSTFSSIMHKGATSIYFTSIEDLFEKLLSIMIKTNGDAYLFVYWGNIDSVAHLFGPEGIEYANAVNDFSKNISNLFLSKISKEIAEKFIILLTSDHGQSSINENEIIYLNDYNWLEDNYTKSPSLKWIPPTGGCHNVFLFIKEDKIQETIIRLEKELYGKARIILITDALLDGLFGLNNPSKRFLKRIGNILILPNKGFHVWYKYSSTKKFSQLGTHGGLSNEEMIIPFAVAKLENIL